MIRLYCTIIGVLLTSSVIAAQNIPQNVVEQIKFQTAFVDGMHSVNIDGRTYDILIKGDEIKRIKRTVIYGDFRQLIDSTIVDYIEEAYAANLLSIDSPKFDDIEIINGNWAMLEALGNLVECNLVYDEFKYITIALKSDKYELSIRFGIDYQKFNSGTRTDIENRFIEELVAYKVEKCREIPNYTVDELVDIGNGNFLLRGTSYLTTRINQNSYLSKDASDSLCFIVNAKQPVATFSNMVVLGVGYDAVLKMSILTHEYGTQTTVTVPLEQFIQYCISKGCEIYWGYDRLESGVLYGTIFCCNKTQGYEHIANLHCDLGNLGKDNFAIESRVSLFIPTTNVQNTVSKK